MKGSQLGEFEELVLLVVGVLGQSAYGVSVTEEIEKQTGRGVSLSAVHTALYRLEEKSFINSVIGGATQKRGGRRKRLYTITSAGKANLNQIRLVRNRLWDLIPQSKLNLGDA
ncbi:MAG: helix-turn-helix transcriptional regulator [Bacteroidota bacterium]